MLRKNPGFASVAVITLALGIGATTSIFSVVNAVLLRPLPYEEPDRLVWVTEVVQAFKGQELVLAPDFIEWREQNRVFSNIAGYSSRPRNLSRTGEPLRIVEGQVTDGFLPMLGVKPILGRGFHPEEDQPGQNGVVLLTDSLWRRSFGSSRDVLGKSIALDEESCSIIGVLPVGFEFPNGLEVDLVRPLGLDVEAQRSRRVMFSFQTIARLHADVAIEQAKAELDAIQGRVVEEAPQMKGWEISIKVLPLHEQLVGNVRTALLVLLAAVGFVLLLACLNAGSLLLANAATRQREITVRAALGAGRWRLIRQLLAEGFLLASVGCVLGLILAIWLRDALISISPPGVQGIANLAFDYRVLLFAVAATVLTALIFSLAPGVIASHLDLSSSLKTGAKGVSSGSARVHTLRVLVVSEIALALVLVVGAGLMTQSFLRLRHQDLGFRSDHILTLSVHLTKASYPEAHHQAQFYQRSLKGVRTLPGVQSAAWVSVLPPHGAVMKTTFVPEGEPDPPPLTGPAAFHYAVTEDYFRLMSVPLLAGSFFTGHETREAVRHVLVNETLARHHLPSESPLGKRIRLARGTQGPWYTVVGVVADIKNAGLEADPLPAIFHPLDQFDNIKAMTLVVRTVVDPFTLAAAITHEIHEIDPNLPLSEVQTLDQHLTRAVAQPRFTMVLLAGFAGSALLLAAVGIYGVMAYVVRLQTHEFGIRMALGAQASEVRRLVLRKGLLLTGVGVALGIAGALALTRTIVGLLYQVSATDPLTFIGVAALLALVATAACYFPARRATKVDPMVALRYE